MYLIKLKKYIIFIFITLSILGIISFKNTIRGESGWILIPMDHSQSEHLKAYGVVYRLLDKDIDGKWLINYRGGSFLVPNISASIRECLLYNVKYEELSDKQLSDINKTINENNMETIDITIAPKIAVYTPDGKEPWDDAVTLVLTYANISYDTIWDREVLSGKLEDYNWIHLHHEDFTGQMGKFYAYYNSEDWYIKMYNEFIQSAKEAGFDTIQEHKCAVAKKIREYVHNGGFLFAMCAACDTIDIALSADGIPIVPEEICGFPPDPNAEDKLDFSKTFAFENFELIENPAIYEFSTIDIDVEKENLRETPDIFQLFDFSAKIDPIPTMLTQNHEKVVKGFLGQTTGFYEEYIKDRVTILGKTPNTDRIKYIYSTYGKGFFSFYGGHDPEDYRHFIGDPPTDLSLYPNSAGYRIILNNILFPASKKKPRKTL